VTESSSHSPRLSSLTPDQYLEKFVGKDGSDPVRKLALDSALRLALDIRKFEIELYWKRATYFWAFIAAAFAGYGLSLKAGGSSDAWLTTVFSSLGLIFSFAWFLVNRGSKFWQENWERHVDILEDQVLGPLYKVVAVRQESIDGNPLISAGPYSVSKINQILSAFVGYVWIVLFLREMFPLPLHAAPNFPKIVVFLLTFGAIGALYELGRSTHSRCKVGLNIRDV
jgi:hypothetical protein